MSEAADHGPAMAVDLGCGPGYTTHMLAGAVECEQVVGLDNSERFIRLAGKTATDKISFLLHDVATAPFSTGPADLIYARFLLTHQSQPERLMARWATQLRPAGRMLLEETDSIHITEPVFAEYIEIVTAMLTDAGHDLYVGPRLDAMPTPAGLTQRLSRVASVPVTNDLAARMFSMNINTWKHNEFVQQNCSPASIRRLEENLREIAAKPTDEVGIQWRMRQLVYEREN